MSEIILHGGQDPGRVLLTQKTYHGELVIEGHSGTPIQRYTGPYEFTPGDEAQTVQIAGKQATENITINPIPSNYGKVTYNGRIITIT